MVFNSRYSREDLMALAMAEAQRAGVDPTIMQNLIQAESAWNPTAMNPKSGAFGLTQAMPSTAADPGFGVTPMGDQQNPQEQLRFGADYLAAMQNQFPGDMNRALAAYNWGPGNAQSWDGSMANLPEETRNYINQVNPQAVPSTMEMLGQSQNPNLMDAANQPPPENLAMGGPNPNAPPQQPQALLDEPQTPGMFEEGGMVGPVTMDISAGLAALAQGMAQAQTGQTQDLTGVREQFFRKRRAEAQQAQKEQARTALAEVFNSDPRYSKYAEALSQGADPYQLLPMFQQEQAAATRQQETSDDRLYQSAQRAESRDFAVQQAEADRDFRAGESEKDRELRLLSMQYRGGGNALSSTAKDYEYMQSFPDTPEGQAAKEDFMAYLRRRSPVLSVDEDVAAARRKEVMKRDIARVDGMRDDDLMVQRMISGYEEMRHMLDSTPGMSLGRISNYFRPFEAALNEAGVLPERWQKAADVREMVDMIHNSIFPNFRPIGSGATSNWEGEIYAASTPSGKNTVQSMRAGLDYYEGRLKREQAFQEFVSGKVTGQENMSYDEAKKEWDAMAKRGDPLTRPRFANLDDFTASNILSMKKPPAIGDIVYYNGKPTPLTPGMLEIIKRRASEENR